MRRQSRTHKRLYRRPSRIFWPTVVALAALILILRLAVFHTVRIEGSSMKDTLHSGDIVLVSRIAGKPERGDIVECRFPGRSGTYVKRLTGLPGETVEIRSGTTYVNGQAVPEPWLTSFAEDYFIELGTDEYLLLGDNRAESYDSREADMGPIGREDIIGRVIFSLWPPKIIN